MKKLDSICVSFSLIVLLASVVVHSLALLVWKDVLPNKEISTLAVLGIGFLIGLSFLFSLAAIGVVTKKLRFFLSGRYRHLTA